MVVPTFVGISTLLGLFHAMSAPLLIIVSGAPGAGKTTVGKGIAQEIGIPFMSKDTIKESLFDTLGYGDRDWSMRLGAASIGLLFRLVEIELEAGKSVVAEMNFQRHFDRPRFKDLARQYPFRPIEVHCTAGTEVLLTRYDELYDEIKQGLADGRWDPLDVGGPLLTVDTTEFDTLDVDALWLQISVAADSAGIGPDRI